MAEPVAHGGGQHLQDDHDQQQVQGGAQLDQERHPGGEQEGDQRDAVVDQQQADDLRHRLASGDQHEQPDQDGGQPERRQTGRRPGEGRDEPAHRQVGDDHQPRRADQGGGHVHQRGALPAGGVAPHHPGQQAGNDQPFGHEHHTGDGTEAGVAAVDGQHGGQSGQSHTLEGQDSDDGSQVAPPQGHHRAGQDHPGGQLQQVQLGSGDHRVTSPVITPTTASTNPPARSSGTRKSRSLAVETSTAEITAPNTAALAATAPRATATAVTPAPEAMPQGANRFTTNANSSPRRIASPKVTRASSGPAYSRIMASWTMVSSRWVDGLSTGIRPVSAITTITSATRARSRSGLAAHPGWATVAATMPGRLEVPAWIDRARMATSRAGSANAPMVMARLEPRPPNAVPASRPPRAKATDPINSR